MLSRAILVEPACHCTRMARRNIGIFDENFTGIIHSYNDHQAGRFDLLNSREMLVELYGLFPHTDLSQGLFHANHASNYLPIRARLPRDKDKILNLIDRALNGQVALKPEWLRAL